MEPLQAEGLSLRFDVPATIQPSLEQQIQQLIKQRGAFRHLSSQSLQEEIDQSRKDDENPDNNERDVEAQEDIEKPQARQERLWQAREEMLQKLAYAQNEILSALDFVSLLLSGKSVAAQTSMSPALKQVIPVGTLEGSVVERKSISATNSQKLDQVSEGWKSEGFKTIAHKFGQAASRLEGEAQRQSKYWYQIADLKAQGWSVSRLPSDSRTIGVHYGFPEAARQFRARSFAHLQQNESGDLDLDPRSVPEKHTTVRVAIVRNGVETGTSSMRCAVSTPLNKILEQVNNARDAIFEEELFHEISREARILANQKAHTQPSAVEANLDSETLIRIMQTDVDQEQRPMSNVPDDVLAEYISTNLRLLLLLEHDKLRLRRCEAPRVMSITPPSLPEYALLRPILANLRHQASVSALNTICKQLADTCSEAGLPFHYHISKIQQLHDITDIQSLHQPVRSRVTAQLDHGQDITIEVETYLGSPVYGTVYRSSILDFGFVRYQAGSFNTEDEAGEFLSRAMTLELMSRTREFTVIKPHAGEVVFKATGTPEAVISVRPQLLSLRVRGSTDESYSWRALDLQGGATNGTGSKKSYKDVVKTLDSK